jgi:phosphoenolpyruvate synthase/pyruvate phosphate dikinase
MAATYIRWFSEIALGDLALVGGKNASLGEMHNGLAGQGVHVPPGFAITAQAYRDTLEAAGTWPRLGEALAGLDVTRIDETVLRRKLGAKETRMVYAPAAGREATRVVAVAGEDRERYCLRDEEILAIADATLAIEAHHGARAGRPVPVDVEWAQDGPGGPICVVQARPETVASLKPLGQLESRRLDGDSPTVDYPEMATFVVEHGIDSVSVSPDTLAVTRTVLDAERRLGHAPRGSGQ